MSVYYFNQGQSLFATSTCCVHFLIIKSNIILLYKNLANKTTKLVCESGREWKLKNNLNILQVFFYSFLFATEDNTRRGAYWAQVVIFIFVILNKISILWHLRTQWQPVLGDFSAGFYYNITNRYSNFFKRNCVLISLVWVFSSGWLYDWLLISDTQNFYFNSFYSINLFCVH